MAILTTILTAIPLLWQSVLSVHTQTLSDLSSSQSRRLAVALRLLPQRFDLGFCALHAFCPAQTARIFAAVVSKLAGQGRTAELRSLLQNIQGTVTSDEWDQACLKRLQLCWMLFISLHPMLYMLS